MTALALLVSFPVMAQSGAVQSSSFLGHWQFGAVLDIAQVSRPAPLGLRGEGLGLGHSDLLARGTLGRHLSAEIVAAGAVHEGEFERGIEKMFIQSRSLPSGLQARAGRFASQVGYLNEQHPHADDFTERPPLYRAFLGHHYFDDGLRLNWTAPTPFLLQLGAEAFSGRKLSPEGPRRARAGVSTFTVKVGSDMGAHQAWQAGLSVLENRRAAPSAHEDPSHEHPELAHGHGAAFAGRRLSMVDLAWKWAPDGNTREQQIRVVLEQAQLSGLPDAPLTGRRHEARSLALVWRFRPDWEAGLRADRLRASLAHDDQAEAVRLDERAAMVVYKPSHRQWLRLQWTSHGKPEGLETMGRRQVSLQYGLAFGAHGAHNF